MNPLISVIVPVYNVEKYLDRCVKSIINQTYSNLEIILVDDGSSDNSPKICDEYAKTDDRIKVIHKENGGVCSARNIGLEHCKGEYVGFVDSDDWLAPTMYENLLPLCSGDGIIATTSASMVTKDGVVALNRAFSNELVSTNEFVRRILCRKDGCAVWSRLFPRDVIGDSRFNEERLNEEILFWLSILDRIKGVKYTSDIGYYYFYTQGSLSRCFGKSVHDMIGNSKEVKKYINKIFPSLSKEAEQFVLYQHMNFLLACPFDYDRNNDSMYVEVLSYLRKHIMVGIKTPHFTKRDKAILLIVSFFPRLISLLIEKKRKRINI